MVQIRPRILSLLKEIGGTGVYEERRKESLKVMAETESRRTQIEETMGVIEDKLKELDDERKELAEYTRLDKQRRCIEYSLADADLASTRADLVKVQEDQSRVREAALKATEDVERAATELKALDQELAGAVARKNELQGRKDEAKAHKANLASQLAAAEAEVHDLRSRVSRDEQRAGGAKKEAQQLDKKIQKAQAALEQARAAHSTAEKEELRIRGDLETQEARLKQLYQKQGRSQSFATQKDRDVFLKQELTQTEATLGQEEARAEDLQGQMHEANEQLKVLAQVLSDREADAQRFEEGSSSGDKHIAEVRLERDRLQNSRKEAWGREAELRKKCEGLQAELRARKADMNRHMAHDIARGLQGLERLVTEHNVAGVHGRLVDLIDCAPQLSTAVEVTAGNQLFHVVVETDDVAMRCSELLVQYKLGRVSFMPLNTLKASEPKCCFLFTTQSQYPTEYGSDVVPLAKKVKCDAKYEPAVRQVFGKTVLCRNEELAKEVARVGTFSCVTMEGTQVNKRGALTGGYHDPSASRMDIIKAIRTTQKELEEAQKALSDKEAELANIDARVASLTGEISKDDMARQRKRSETASLKDELKSAKRDQADKQNEVESLSRETAACEARITRLRSKAAATREELASPMLGKLSEAERAEAESLPSSITLLKEAQRVAGTAAATAAAKLASASSLLYEDLLKRKEELVVQADEGGLKQERISLESLEAEAAEVVSALNDAEKKLTEADKALEAAAVVVAEVTKKKEALGDSEGRRGRAAATEAGAMEVLASRRSALLTREGDLQRRIRELGSLPADAFEKYKGKSSKALHKQLDKVVADIAKFGSVNRKALDQYTSFTEQREELGLRKTELDRSEAKIRELIQALDMRKDEAIERTFKGVAKHFRDVFSELVPGGRGELVMQKRLPGVVGAVADVDGDEEAVGGTHEGGTLEKYSGVKVRISFTRGGETMSLKQLSGGQRTLVALALIFAIQRCDPAPFYLFDEIDAALDPQYRTTVAKMLRRQADESRNPAQFIVTTFHPQIVGEADQLYGVSHTNRVSRVYTIRREDALAFLQVPEDQQAQNEGILEKGAGGGHSAGQGTDAGQGTNGLGGKAASGSAGRAKAKGAHVVKRKRGRGAVTASSDEEDEEEDDP